MLTFATRDRSVKPARPSFALGLSEGCRLIRAWTSNNVCFDLVEDEAWHERFGAYPYTLFWTKDGEAGSRGFDSRAEAETLAWHLSTPLPEEAIPAQKHVSSPARTFEPTATDRQWWCENAPAALPPISGGAPEPELGLSGSWYAPGEIVADLWPEERGLSDDASGAWGGHAD